jgi:hypothetical protein
VGGATMLAFVCAVVSGMLSGANVIIRGSIGGECVSGAMTVTMVVAVRGIRMVRNFYGALGCKKFHAHHSWMVEITLGQKIKELLIFHLPRVYNSKIKIYFYNMTKSDEK